MSELAAAIREFLRDSGGGDVTSVTHDTPLFSNGIIDSCTLMSLMALVGKQLGFRVDPDDVTLANSETLARM